MLWNHNSALRLFEQQTQCAFHMWTHTCNVLSLNLAPLVILLSGCEAAAGSSVNITPPHPLGFILYPPAPYKSAGSLHTESGRIHGICSLSHVNTCTPIKLRWTALPPIKSCELSVVCQLLLPKLWCAENTATYINIISSSYAIKTVKNFLKYTWSWGGEDRQEVYIPLCSSAL